MASGTFDINDLKRRMQAAVSVLKQVGTATSVYLIPLPDCVMRTRTVAATPF